MIDLEIISDAIFHFGPLKQTLKAIEELSELSRELSIYNRNGDYERELQSNWVVDEIADVTIMIAQLRQIFGCELVDQRVQLKLQRLKERIEKEKRAKSCAV